VHNVVELPGEHGEPRVRQNRVVLAASTILHPVEMRKMYLLSVSYSAQAVNAKTGAKVAGPQ